MRYGHGPSSGFFQDRYRFPKHLFGVLKGKGRSKFVPVPATLVETSASYLNESSFRVQGRVAPPQGNERAQNLVLASWCFGTYRMQIVG